ncbi:DUF397 domain-containing protein [Actinomadura soli]|uniref:DUF397 domain-containing protein n=1 Tax=Actinomadura soli TaxID=2508997 RepID=A0A5C4JHA5_9ACTN|nr:DUF397 domain-containing protein [Actinomadura soli]TMR05427.1 DUF397 domain-containing protein [Actinomadura soli]
MKRPYEFVKGTLCNGENSGCGCVEVATNLVDDKDGGVVAVRDTKTGAVLEFDRHEWEGFLKSAKNNEFDI